MNRFSEYNERLSFRSLTTVPDTKGGFEETFSTVHATLWGKVTPSNSSEGYAQDRNRQEIRYTVEIRYKSTIVPTMRIVLADARVLRIIGIMDPDRRKRKMIINCEEVPST